MEKNKVSKASILFMVVMLVMAASMAFGFTEPTSGFAVEVKELTVDDIIKGAIGFTVVAAGVAWGGYNILAKGQWLMGIGSIIGGAVIGLSPTIVTSMGLLY